MGLLGLQRPTSDAAGERGGLGRVKGSQLDRGELTRELQLRHEAGQGVPAVEPFGARGTRDEQPGVTVEAKQEVQPLQRVEVAPLEIVEHQQQRPVGGHDGTGKRFEEHAPLPVLDASRGPGHIRALAEQLRNQPRDLAQRADVQPGQC